MGSVTVSSSRLLLTYEPGCSHPHQASPWAGAGPWAAQREPAGWLHFEFALLQAGVKERPVEASSSSDDDEGAEAAGGAGGRVHASGSVSSGLDDPSLQPPPGVSWKKSKAKKKQVKSKELDYYALLGLANERWLADEAQLKQAYRRACLEHHPDKKLVGVECEDAKVAAEEHFKKIQEAYDTLSDPAKRREYDSTDEFDDSLPLDCDPADFFKVFAPAFKRNARWSTDPKVPDVGDEATPWEQVSAFYDFWYGFKSWREFPHPDEEDVEGAESREHRRWIERINAKLREKGKKDEGRRLREFVDAAYRLDPRVAAYRAAQAAERERRKQEKAEAKRREEAEAQAKRDAEEARRAAEAEAAKAAAAEAKRARELEKRAVKKERQRLRQLSEAGGQRLVSEDDTERLCQSLDLQQLQQLGDLAAAAADAPARAALLRGALDGLSARESAEAREREAKKREAEAALKDLAARDHARKVASMREWGDEELRLLDKAVKKFPMGTPKRWEQVAAYVRTRTLDEVLLMVKEHQGASSTRMKSQEDWKGAAKKRAEVTSEADSRDCAFTDVQVKLAAPAAAAANGSSGSTPASSRHSSSTAGAPPPQQATSGAAAAAQPPAAAGAAPAAAAPAAPAAAGAAAPAAAGAKPNKVVSADSGEWSEEQELALVQALKQFGKELPDRWERIAAAVPGKTKAGCMRRFKELKEVFKAKKAG